MHLGIKNKGYVVELKPLNEVYTITYTVITKLKAEKNSEESQIQIPGQNQTHEFLISHRSHR